ncbi:MAG: copper resistance protein NlpE N-terminal domain-containing protein [Elusimicrobia bacterium]|nr:copper resistance protein NlpE N-terminal domain-containing protein [Elusimicrobiota bacterium]
MKKVLFAVFAGAVLLAACSTATKTTQPINNEYTGTFAGVVPCADCAGINTELTLNPDSTYQLRETYLKDAPQTFSSKGKWMQSDDQSVTLKDSKTKTKNYYAFNGKDELKKLDMQGKPIDSDFNYTLKRKTQDFNFVQGKVWQLSQVQNAAGQITFDSSKLNKEFFNDIYTIQFDNGRASGKGSPNRYNAPYTLGGGNNMTFQPAAATLMLGIREPEGLNEHGFFQLLSKVYGWDIIKNQLVLYTVNDNNEKQIMIFGEFDYR